MNDCPRCGDRHDAGATAQFCPSCGADLREWKAANAKPASSGELLRSLLDIATHRDIRVPPGGSEPMGAESRRSDRAEEETWTDVRVGPLQQTVASLFNEPQPTFASILDQAESVLRAQAEADPTLARRVVDLLCLVAGADGNVDDEERTALARTLGVLLGGELHTRIVVKLIQGSLAEIAQAGVEKSIASVASALRTANASEEGLVLGIAMAYVSDGFSAPEREVIHALAQAMGVGSGRLTVLMRRVRHEVDPV